MEPLRDGGVSLPSSQRSGSDKLSCCVAEGTEGAEGAEGSEGAWGAEGPEGPEGTTLEPTTACGDMC